MILTIITGCRKDDSPELIRSNTPNKTSANGLNTDDLTELRNQFKLEHVDVIPSGIPSVSFNSIEEAKAFLENAENSTFEQKKPTEIPVNKMANKNFTKSTASQLMGGSSGFTLFLPNASLIIAKKFRYDWPSGFVIMGNLEGDGVVSTGSRWSFNKIRCENPTIDPYGFTFMTSWQTNNIYFQQRGGFGTEATIRFSGMLKIVLVIKDLGEVYSRPMSGIVIARFGPWSRGNSENDLSVDNSYNTILSYHTS